MKQKFRWVLVSVVAGAICPLVTNRIAYHRSHNSGEVSLIQHQTMVTSFVTLGALQELRAGDIPGATRLTESSCFGESEMFFHNPTCSNGAPKDDGAAKQLTKELLQYRAIYRTNSADWDDGERKLEAELAKVK
jgi:hypothetical protein